MILDGKQVAHGIQQQLKSQLTCGFSRPPCLVAVLSTDNPASLSYVSRKVAACHEVGIASRVVRIVPKATAEMVDLVDQLNADSAVDGILIQLPLPDHIESTHVLERIAPEKDVDGFHPVNLGKVLLGRPDAFYPCTPLGIKVLLEHYKIDLKGKHVVIVGRSNIVGKPLAVMLLQNAAGCNATVTVAHSMTKNLKELTLSADILVAAIGKPHFITADMIRPGAVVVDVGINTVPDPTKRSGVRLVGDVDFDSALPRVQAITPVPGGVGPMTIAILLQNTIKSFLTKYRSN